MLGTSPDRSGANTPGSGIGVLGETYFWRGGAAPLRAREQFFGRAVLRLSSS